MIYGLNNKVEHIFRYFSNDSIGYGNRLLIVQNISCVTGACIMTSKKKYLEVNGLDELFKMSFNDVDYCLKFRDKSYFVIFNPFVECIHNELTTRGDLNTNEKIILYEKEKFFNRWKSYIELYYNKNLTLNDCNFSMKPLNNGIYQIYNNLKNNYKYLESNYNYIKSSWSYRIGRLFTYPISIPLDFYRFIRDYNLIKKSGLFDSEYYLANNEDVKKAKMNPIKHYLKFGWKEGRNPSPFFYTNDYISFRPDILNADICPLVHYELFGKREFLSFCFDKIKHLEKKISDLYNKTSNLDNNIARDKLNFETFKKNVLFTEKHRNAPKFIYGDIRCI